MHFYTQKAWGTRVQKTEDFQKIFILHLQPKLGVIRQALLYFTSYRIFINSGTRGNSGTPSGVIEKIVEHAEIVAHVRLFL